MRFSLDYEQKVRRVEMFIPSARYPTISSSFYCSVLYYSLQVLNRPNGYHGLTNVSDLLQLMAVGNQAGKTFVWDIGVDDPTKAR